MIELVDLYKQDAADFGYNVQFLYDLMAERLLEGDANITHVQMPTWKEHIYFIASHTYQSWYIIRSGANLVGSVTLRQDGELGIVIRKPYRRHGYAREALIEVMRRHQPEPPHAELRPFIANIRAGNEASIALFESLGAILYQRTYHFPTDKTP